MRGWGNPHPFICQFLSVSRYIREIADKNRVVVDKFEKSLIKSKLRSIYLENRRYNFSYQGICHQNKRTTSKIAIRPVEY